MYKFIIPLFALAFLLVSCSPKAQEPITQESFKSLATLGDGSVPDTVEQTALEKARASFDGTYLKGKHTAVIKTPKGEITVELDADAAPKTVTNFVLLAKAGYYDGITIHRVIPDFMIQMGDPNGNGTGGESIYGPKFEDEINADSYGLDKKTVKDVAGDQPVPPEIADLPVKDYYQQYENYRYDDSLTSLPMTRGALAMANGGANTNGSQFFIIQRESTPWLEGKHTVFGKVTEGLDVVDLLANLQRDGNDLPHELVKMMVEVKN
jgi:cyclophilin family peptidyl-prolyl cis-trans isomerase